MKTIGLLFIFLACLGTGVTAVGKVRERIELLYGLVSLLKHIKNEMYLHMTEYGEILREANIPPTEQITNIICTKLQLGSGIKESTSAAFSTRYAKRLLKDEERSYLTDTISSAAQTDLDHAEKLIDCACVRLEAAINEDIKKRADEERLRLSLALYGGLAAVILLM